MRARLGQALLLVAALAAAWSIAVALSGGFVLRLGALRLSSRRWQAAAMVAVIGATLAWVTATPEQRRLAWHRVRDWRRWPRWIDLALPIALAGVTLRLVLWGAGRPLWLDEEMIAINVRGRGFADLAGPLWLAQTAPLGWLWLERALFVAFGGGEVALRAAPLAFGLGTIATALWAGWRWLNRAGSTVLMGLCAFGPWLIYNSLELKPYSADAFWGLLLPVLAVWAAGPGSASAAAPADVNRRVLAWWIVAALGQWFANGALLVTPACAVVLAFVSLRRHGWAGLWPVAWPGLLWLAAFGLHYALSIRHALASNFLAGYWAFAMPPAGAAMLDRLAWMGGRFEALAVNPAGSRAWLPFWLAVAGGLALSRRPVVTALLAAVPLSAFALAGLRLVPLFERLSIWILPALYLAVAVCASRGLELATTGARRPRWVTATAGAAALVVATWATVDIVGSGSEYLSTDLQRYATNDNHELDDRAAVRWLLGQRRPGDVVITTELALPAIWWYGDVSLDDAAESGGRLSDGTPILRVGFAPARVTCGDNELRAALAGHRRALVYLGFRFDDVPRGFDGRLLVTLEQLGLIVATERFSTAGRAVIVELIDGARSTEDGTRTGAGALPAARGCLTIETARRW